MNCLKFSLSQKQIAFCSIAVLTVLLIPMVIIGFYDHPSYDDFGYAALTVKAYREHSSIIAAALKQIKVSYYAWQGTYSAIFLFSLHPAIFGEAFYCLTTPILLISLIGSTAYFMKLLCCDVLNFSKYSTITLTCIILALCTQLPESAVEAFYWYNGSIFYTFFFSLMLLFFSCIIKQLFIKKDKKCITALIAAPLLSVIIAGGNYVTALLTIVLLFFFCLYVIWKRKEYPVFIRLWVYLIFVLFAIGFLINTSAPGNAVRQSYLEKQDPIHAIILAFGFTIDFIRKWCNSLVIPAAMLFVTPILYSAAKKTNFSFKYPLLAPVISVILIAIQFTPPSYAQSSSSAGRLKNIIFYSFVFLFAFCIYYICGWISHRIFLSDGANGTEDTAFEKNNLLYYGSIAIIAIALLWYTPNFNQVTSVSAAVSLKNGEAQAYDAEVNERLKILEDPEQKDVEFVPLKNRPYVLFWSDIRPNPVKEYYEKNSVTLKY